MPFRYVLQTSSMPPRRSSVKREEPSSPLSDSADVKPISSTPKKRVKLSSPPETPSTPVPTAQTTATPLSASAKKKLLDLSKNWGQTPYPDFPRPTPEQCQDVYERLCSVHGKPERPKVLEDRPNAAAGCGQVPDVLDAVVRTILSQNTTSKNSTAAKNAIDKEYGRAAYRAVLDGGEERLAATIQCGGLAKVKAKAIIKILERLEEKEGSKGKLSLDYLHEMSDRAAMEELCSFDLVGVKTASCVLLFCLGRESFAVDTHVHRITISLNWCPPAATRDTAFFHLDSRIPSHLKYPLHSLLVRHGRGCVKCSANGVTSMDHVEECPISDLIGARGKSKSKSKPKKANNSVDKEDLGYVVEKADEEDEKMLKNEVKAVIDSSPPKRSTRSSRSSSSAAAQKDKIKHEAEEEVEEKPTIPRKQKKGSVAADEASMSGIFHGLEG